MIWIFLAAFILLMIWAAVKTGDKPGKTTKTARTHHNDTEMEFFNTAARISNRGYDAVTTKAADKAVTDYEIAFDHARPSLNEKDIEFYEKELKDLRKIRDDFQRDDWYEKADKALDKFYELYEMITDPDFRDVEKAYKSKARCLKYWQDYFRSMPDDETWYYPKQHLREMTWYEPCMDNYEALEKKLSDCIEKMKPEYKRKLALKKRIVDMVAEHETILRAELMKGPYPGCTELEVKYCYKELIEKYILSEVKYSNRYIVSLSEKEKMRRQKNNPPDAVQGDRV